MDYFGRGEDDRKRKKSRNDSKHDKQSSHHKHHHHTSSHHDRVDDDNDSSFYSNKKSSRSRSPRSRSRSQSRINYSNNDDRSMRNTAFNHKQNSCYQQQHQQYQQSQHRHSNKYDDSVIYSFNGSNNGNNNNLSATKPFNPGVPSKTIMLRQLPVQMDDHELRTEFNMMCVPYKEIRLVKNRETGLSRGFAFVEFNTVEEAQRWMIATQGHLIFSNYSNKVQLFYSHSNEDNSESSRRANLATDWDCAKCSIKNFKRRDRCFKCGISREESERRRGGEGYDHVGSTPCNTLLIRGLDALTAEETMLDVLYTLSNNTLQIKNYHIARDSLTNVSCGYALIEMNSIQDASTMLQILHPNFEIDGKQIVANFSKNTFKTALTQLETSTKMPYQSSISYEPNPIYHSSNKANQADQANSAAAVAQAALINMHKKQEILSHITSSLKNQPVPTSNNNSGDSVVDSSVTNNLQLLAKQVDLYTNKTYTAPDVSKFTYDEMSGYYYDYTTGFYYDATSQYYFNSMTQQYMYWDAVKSTYIPVATTALADSSGVSTEKNSNVESNSTEIKIKDNQEENSLNTSNSVEIKSIKTTKTVKTAAQIAKDMERWAESMNKKKESVKKTTTTTTTITSTTTTVPTATSKPATVVQIEASKQTSEIGKLEKPGMDDSSKPIENNSKKTSNPENDRIENSDSENSQEQKQIFVQIKNQPQTKTTSTVAAVALTRNDSSFIDTTKMACLLCKRRFDSIDILNKHVLKSDLHKKNLEKFNEDNKSSEVEESEIKKNDTETSLADSLKAALQYRDRAKERRAKYGTPEPPSPPYSSTPGFKSKSRGEIDEDSLSSFNSSVSTPKDGGESVASKLMRKMGWNEGVGLGKNLQGISSPIEATIRQKGAGLGASNLELDPNDSYKDAVRKSARARFEQLS